MPVGEQLLWLLVSMLLSAPILLLALVWHKWRKGMLRVPAYRNPFSVAVMLSLAGGLFYVFHVLVLFTRPDWTYPRLEMVLFLGLIVLWSAALLALSGRGPGRRPLLIALLLMLWSITETGLGHFPLVWLFILSPLVLLLLAWLALRRNLQSSGPAFASLGFATVSAVLVVATVSYNVYAAPFPYPHHGPLLTSPHLQELTQPRAWWDVIVLWRHELLPVGAMAILLSMVALLLGIYGLKTQATQVAAHVAFLSAWTLAMAVVLGIGIGAYLWVVLLMLAALHHRLPTNAPLQPHGRP